VFKFHNFEQLYYVNTNQSNPIQDIENLDVNKKETYFYIQEFISDYTDKENLVYSFNNLTYSNSTNAIYNTTFPNLNSDILIYLSMWQYWWWFWFLFLSVFYYFFLIKIIFNRQKKINPRINTSIKSHGKWGDLIVGLIPIYWCINILTNSNFLLKTLEWQTESNLFTIRIRGKQWYWIYKIDLFQIDNIMNLNKNVGHNKIIRVNTEVNTIFLLNKLVNQLWHKLFFKRTKKFFLKSNKFKTANKSLQSNYFVKKLNIKNYTIVHDHREGLLERRKIRIFFVFTQHDVGENFMVDYEGMLLQYLKLRKKKTKRKFVIFDLNKKNQFNFFNKLKKKHINTKFISIMHSNISDNYSNYKNCTLTDLKLNKILPTNKFFKHRSFINKNLKIQNTWHKLSLREIYPIFKGKSKKKIFLNKKFSKKYEISYLCRQRLTNYSFSFHKYKKKLMISFSENRHKKYKNNMYFILKQTRANNFENLIIGKSKLNYNFFTKPSNDVFKDFKKSNLFYLDISNRLLNTNLTLVLPANINMATITNSYDVIHSWFVPGLGIKMDCVPGRSTHHSFYFDVYGLFFGQCAEICGRFHHHMPIKISIVYYEIFLLWFNHYTMKLLYKTHKKKNKNI